MFMVNNDCVRPQSVPAVLAARRGAAAHAGGAPGAAPSAAAAQEKTQSVHFLSSFLTTVLNK